MRLLKNICCMCLFLLLLSGCKLTGNSMENINIYTTTYPLKYLITSLYGEHAKIYSIYPIGATLNNYKLSDKKLEEYSKSDLFIFNSLDKEKDRDYAVKMININKNLRVIDVAMNMRYENGIEELWLNPNEYLMMAENIRKGLAEYINNPYLVNEINDKYEDLEYDISKLDANLNETIDAAKYKTIVVDSDIFKFLNQHGLRVISLEENDSLNSNVIEEVNSLIDQGKIKYIYSAGNETNDTVNNIISNRQLELVPLNTMNSIDGNINNSNDNYLSVMTNNINLLKKELYKE